MMARAAETETVTIEGFEKVTMPSRYDQIQVAQMWVTFVSGKFDEMELSGRPADERDPKV